MAAPPRFPAWLLAVMLALMAIAIYWPVTGHDFVNCDDDLFVTANVQVQSGLTLESIRWAFLNPVCYNWHPLTVLSHMADCQLFGLKPWGHHLTNVLLHAGNTVLVFLLLRGLTGALWRSVLVAALFGLHPLHVESVAWVAERKDVLSACFGFLALLFYGRYAQQSEVRKLGGKTMPALDYGLALFFFALGLMSKPMLVTWPFVLLLLDYWPLGRMKNAEGRRQKEEGRRQEAENRRLGTADGTMHHAPRTTPHVSRFTVDSSPTALLPLVLEKLPFFVLAGLMSVVTFFVQKQGGILMPVDRLPLGARVGNAMISYRRYLGKLFWPMDLAALYPHPGHWPTGKVLLAGVLIAGITALVLVPRRRYPFLLVGWLWYCGTLLPAIQLVQQVPTRWRIGMLIFHRWGS